MHNSKKDSLHKSRSGCCRKYGATSGIYDAPLIVRGITTQQPKVIASQMCVSTEAKPSPFCRVGLRVYLNDGKVHFIEWGSASPSGEDESEGMYHITPGYFGNRGGTHWQEWGPMFECKHSVVFNDLYLLVQRGAARRKYSKYCLVESRTVWSCLTFVQWLLRSLGISVKEINAVNLQPPIDISGTFQLNYSKDSRPSGFLSPSAVELPPPTFIAPPMTAPIRTKSHVSFGLAASSGGKTVFSPPSHYVQCKSIEEV